jgi:hypothetical protein
MQGGFMFLEAGGIYKTTVSATRKILLKARSFFKISKNKRASCVVLEKTLLARSD